MPCIAKSPEGVGPIFILDKYKCHMMGHIVQMIQNSGCQVENITGFFTQLFHPVDGGYNHPFKSFLQMLCSDWMMGQNINNLYFEAPSCELLHIWVMAAILNVRKETVCNT